MLCAIVGDIDTIATADALMTDRDFAAKYRSYGKKYPSSYGARFHSWIHDDSDGPYNSFGNGSAMRVSPVAWLYDDEGRHLTSLDPTGRTEVFLHGVGAPSGHEINAKTTNSLAISTS